MIKSLTNLTLALLLSTSIFIAKVIRISDGDTIVVLTDEKEQIKIRLEGIDCPELYQDFGQRARQTTAQLCFNKTVRIEKSGIDQYGRTLAFIYVGNVCINKELLRLGMAWQYRYNNDPELAKLEKEARAAKIGLWSQQNPQAPWDFRHKK
jgi:micrococcal nuclease